MLTKLENLLENKTVSILLFGIQNNAKCSHNIVLLGKGDKQMCEVSAISTKKGCSITQQICLCVLHLPNNTVLVMLSYLGPILPPPPSSLALDYLWIIVSRHRTISIVWCLCYYTNQIFTKYTSEWNIVLKFSCINALY